MRLLPRIILSGFGTGFFPVAPGTFGSLLGSGIALFFLLLFPQSSLFLFFGFFFGAILMSLLGVFLLSPSSDVFKKNNSYDAHWITLDEMAGVWMASLPAFFSVHPLESIVFAFLLFRFFDIVKPLGIRAIDAQKTKSSVFVDDLCAGLLSALLLFFGVYAFG